MEKEDIIFHIDVNSAFLSWTAVELLGQGQTVDIRAIPSVIGGDKEHRHGIVLAKSEPAKICGIRTGEPLYFARSKCPNLAFFLPDYDLYRKRSKELMTYLSIFSPVIEQVSVDECYLQPEPMDRHTAWEVSGAIRKGVYDTFGYTVNVGISTVKVLAKMASDFQKPNCSHELYKEMISNKMWPLSIDRLYMAGKASVDVLHDLGIDTIGQLAAANPKWIGMHLKSHGKRLWEYANGIDKAIVKREKEEVKGIGHEVTLPKDICTAREGEKVVRHLCQKVSKRLQEKKKRAGTLSVEIKYIDFVRESRQITLESSLQSEEELFQVACELFKRLWNKSPIRLIGVRAQKLKEEDEPCQLSLFEYAKEAKRREKEKAMKEAVHCLQKKYGENIVQKGSDFSKTGK